MTRLLSRFQWLLFCILLISLHLHASRGDVGTASQYSSPYLPTRCYGNDASQIPSSNLFAAAGDGIWDNGASCGRQYLVRCISSSEANVCMPTETIQVKIVDYAGSLVSSPSEEGTTIVLSETAFGTVAASSATSINVEFQQV